MTELSSEPILKRLSKLNNAITSSVVESPSTSEIPRHLLAKDGLFDALLVLFDECNTDTLRGDAQISSFLQKYGCTIEELRRLRVNINDFEQKKVIGKGHFGIVQVCREKQSGNVYALKTLKKEDTLSQCHVTFYEEERDIMAKAVSPWITHLQYAFQDDENLYLVMDFHPGGDLLCLLDRFNYKLGEDKTKFYLAEITVAIHAVHSMGYVHRDIKPENILIDRCGHIRLADFGSAAKLGSDRRVRCPMPVGTPYYIAPEVLTVNERVEGNSFYGVECDFWSLGILAYEMLFGDTPFKEEKVIDTYANIMNFKNSLKFPTEGELGISKVVQDLIRGLLEEDSKRLGYMGILKHPFFIHIDFNNLGEETPPFIPIVNGADDTSNFDDFEDSPPFLSSTLNRGFSEHSSCVKRFSGRQLPFIGFTYVRPTIAPQSSSSLQCSTLNSTINAFEEAIRDPTYVEEELKVKKRELHTARMEIENLQSGDEHQSQIRQLEKRSVQAETRLKMTQKDREDLEKLIKEKDRGLQKCKHDLVAEKSARSKAETRALQYLREVKEKWKKEEEKKFIHLNDKMEIYRKSAVSLSEYKDDALKKLTEFAQELNKAETIGHKFKKVAKEKSEEVAKLRKLLELNSEPKECKGNCATGVKALALLSAVNVKLEQEQAYHSISRSRLEELEVTNASIERTLESKDDQSASMLENLNDLYASSEKELHTLKGALKENRQKLIMLETEKLDDVEFRLREERKECAGLRAKLECVCQKLDESETSIDSRNASFVAREEELSAKLCEAEKDLGSARKEKENLVAKLAQTKRRDSTYQAKIHELEQCLTTLNETLKKVEFKQSDSSVNEQRVEARTELLQSQLRESQKAQQEEKIEFTKAISDLGKCEREMIDLKVGMRTAQRELKSSQETVQFLRERSKDFRTEIKEKENEIKRIQTKVDGMQVKLDEKELEIGAVKAFNIATTDRRDKEFSEVQAQLKQYSGSNGTIEVLKKMLQDVRTEVDQLRIDKDVLESEVVASIQEKADARTKEDELMKMVRMLEESSDDKEAMILQLKEVCCEQDNQLTIVDEFEQKTIGFDEQIKSGKATCESLQSELKESRTSINEEKSLRLFQEKRVKDLEKRIAEMEAETEAQLMMLQEKMDIISSDNLEMQNQLAEFENELRESDEQKRNGDHLQLNLEGQIELLKVECAGHIRHLGALNDTNFKLSGGMDQAVSKAEHYKSQNDGLEMELKFTKDDYSIKKQQSSTRMAQQTKLIDFLQTKIENPPKRKKTLSTIFGKEKDTSVPLHHSRHYRDMESLLEREKSLGIQLSQKLMKAQAEVVTLKTQVKSQDSDNSVSRTPYSALSKSKNVLQDLSNSPNMKETSTRQRMKHKIPHRWQPHLVMRAGRCIGCLGGIPFSRNALKCQECGVTAHTKCSMGIANTCGLPKAYANHYTQSFKNKEKNVVAKPELRKITLEGFVKVPKLGKAQWERKYACLVGTNLIFYDQPPVKLLQPLKEIELLQKNSYFSVHSAVPRSELPNTPAPEVPFIIKILLRGSDNVSNAHFLMMQTFEQKQIWVNTLEDIQAQACDSDESSDQSNKGTVTIDSLISLQSATPMDVNSMIYIDKKTVLVGATEGLFSFERDPGTGKMTFRARIEGFTTVHQIIMVRSLGIAVFIAGKENLVFLNDMLTLTAASEASQMARPSLTPTRIDPLINCHLVDASEVTDKKTFMCAAASDRISILVWSPEKECFVVCRQFSTQEPCSCFLFTPSSLIVGAERFYKINLKNFEIDEYLDEKDSSLAYAIYGSAQMSSFPVAVIQVSLASQPEEYLLAFYEFGIFVDAQGRRSREFDLKFTRLPVGIIFLRPHLFILHQSSIEIIEIRPESFTRIRGMSFDSDTECAPAVRTAAKNIQKPRFIGKCLSSAKVFAASNCGENLEIVSISTDFPEDFDSSIGWSSVNAGSAGSKTEGDDESSQNPSDTSNLSSTSLSSDAGTSLKRARFPNFMRASKRSKTNSKRDIER